MYGSHTPRRWLYTPTPSKSARCAAKLISPQQTEPLTDGLINALSHLIQITTFTSITMFFLTMRTVTTTLKPTPGECVVYWTASLNSPLIQTLKWDLPVYL
ncbi:hypothetical protein BZY71_22705, partial [Leclercia adecarboxylata]